MIACYDCGWPLQVQRELQEVEILIQQSEPIVKQVATKVNSLLQLC